MTLKNYDAQQKRRAMKAKEKEAPPWYVTCGVTRSTVGTEGGGGGGGSTSSSVVR